MNKWRKTRSGIEGEEMTAAQLAEYRKIKVELREVRLEIDFLKNGGLLRGGSPGEEHDTRTPLREEGNYPTRLMCHCPGGVAFRAATPWRGRGMSETCEAP